jgi:hypothetical protein
VSSFSHNDFYHPRTFPFLRADIRDLELGRYDFISRVAATSTGGTR